MLKLAGVTLAVFIVNLPFGYWRAGLRKFSVPWFLAVHAPVPVVIGIRVLAGVGWHLGTVSVLAVAFLSGQLLGGKLRLSRCQRIT
jgi:hypothetical protein